MEKIQELLEKAGIKPELAGQIVESLDKYKTTLRGQFEAEYTAKVAEARKVCVEEVEAHKRELSRRAQIFCETKGVAIETALAKQSALRESAASTKLSQLSALLAGVEHNGRQNGQSQATYEKLNKKLTAVSEEKKRAVELANKQTAIAERVLARNKALESKIATMKAQPVVTEGVAPARTGRIDTRRNTGRPVTTRPTLVENQDRAPAIKRAPPTPNANAFGVEDIAGNMDEDLV